MNIVETVKKKALCLIIGCIFLITVAAVTKPVAVFAQADYEYSPNRQKYAIAPAALYTNTDFYNSYVKTDAVWAFNSITYFTDNALNYGTEKTDYTATFSKNLADFDPVLESLRKKGDLLINLRVCLANCGFAERQTAAFRYIKEYIGYQSGSEYCVYGDMDYIRYKWGSVVLDYNTGPSGGSRMKNSSLVFADATLPKMQEVYASRTLDGPAANLFNAADSAGSVVYIHVKFNENIRFSDNNRSIDGMSAASHNNIWLKLKVTTIGGSTITDANQRAKLVRLKGDTLTFEYNIPAAIKGDVLNHCITGIDGIVDDDKGGADILNAVNSVYPLRVLTYTGELTGHYTNEGLVTYTSRSLITDLAGNPADTAMVSPKNIIYIDSVSPYIEKVSFDAPENKAQYLGPGYKITPSVTFNEPLYWYNNAIYVPYDWSNSFAATLNVKDTNGSFLSVSGSSFSTDKRTLYFNTICIPEGATVEDASGGAHIRIKSVGMTLGALPVVDARGNAFVYADNDSLSDEIHKDQFLLDTGKPVIATDFNVSSSGKYTPATYDGDGEGKKDTFYFSFGLNDDGSGVQAMAGGGSTLKGMFKWLLKPENNSGIDMSKLLYKYTFVYGSNESPGENQQWYEGKFGDDYTFTQLARTSGADNIYLHIKADGFLGADLDESVLCITAADLVGNKDTKEFVLDGSELNSMLDNTPPAIVIDKLYNYKDASDSNKWKFAADFTLTDKSKVDTGKVYCQWAEKGMPPTEAGWEQIPGLGTNAKTVSSTAAYTLTDGVMNSKDLYIKAVDCSGKENVLQSGPYQFVMDLTKPVYEAEFSGDLTAKASLVLKAEAQSTTIGEGENVQTIPAVILVAVGNSYMPIDNSVSISGDVFSDVFASGGGWFNIGDNSPSTDDSILNSILNGTYYGKIDVRVDIGYGISYAGGVVVSEPYSLLATENYTLYATSGTDKIHDITLASSLTNLTGGGWISPADGPKYYDTIAGATFNIVVNNIRMSAWGSRDIDFENSFFAICRAADGAAVFTAPIGMASTITIPEGLILSDGDYYAKATITAKTSGRSDDSNLINIRIDRTKPEDFGLSMTETLWRSKGESADSSLTEFLAKIGTDAVLYGYDSVYNSSGSYESVYTIFLGSGDNDFATATRKLYFTTQSINNDFYIKVWNATPGAGSNGTNSPGEAEALSKASAIWQHIGNTADNSTGAGFKAVVVNSAADVIPAYSIGVIPIINNTENIVKYQICHANGTESVEKLMLVEVSDEKPQMKVILTPEDLPSKTVTAKITELSSSSSPEMKAYYWAGGSLTGPRSVDEIADAEGNIPLLQTENNWFYTCNIYGNYEIINKRAAHLDNVPPELASADFSQEGDLYKLSVTIKDKSEWDLFMKFDDAYMTRLGISGYFHLEVPETGKSWTADSPRPEGIYTIGRTDESDGTVTLEITGVYLYDDNSGDPKPTADVGYSLYAVDAVGNETTLCRDASQLVNAMLAMDLSETIVTEYVPYYDYYNPSIDKKEISLYSMRASFNQPVKNVTPVQHHNANNSYSLTKDFLSIFKDGSYTVTYQDIFGRNYSEKRDVSVRDDNDMSISMTGLDDEGKFTLSAEPTANEGKDFIPSNEGKAFTVFADIYDTSLLFSGGYIRTINARRDVMQFDRNETAIIAMMTYRSTAASPGWYLSDSNSQIIPLILIDGSARSAPAVVVHWYYHEFASDILPAGETKTDGDVDVWLTSDVPITGINSKLLSHTFTYNDEDSYTFEYTTSDGITDSITATLPVSIVQSKEHQDNGDEYFRDLDLNIDEDDLYKVPPDTTPPHVIFNVYGNYGSYMRNKGIWYNESGTADELKGLFTWSSTFVLKANIIDDSKTKIILLEGIGANTDIGNITYENAQSSIISRVELNGKTVTITGEITDPVAHKAVYPNDFTILLVDEANNKTVISFPTGMWDQLDVIGPWISAVSYKKTDFAKIEAVFKITDDKTSDISVPGDQIELLSPAGLAYNPVTGEYTMTFTENKTVQTTMRDLAGNIGTDNISVADLDDRPPAISSIWWSKGYMDSNGIYDPSQLTVEKSNQTITAKLAFNKPVKKVVLVNLMNNNFDLVPVEHYADYIDWTWDTNGITVDFLQNASISFSFTAANGKEITEPYTCAVFDIIDKDIPTVASAVEDNITSTAATVTFSGFSEPVHVFGPGESGKRMLEPGDTLVNIFTEQGTYIFRFTDEAGNTRTETIKIQNIDEYPPGILVLDLPVTGTCSGSSVTFRATMSEAGTLSFNGISKTVAAPVDRNLNGMIDADVNNNGKVDPEDNECDWVEFTATQNGNFPIVAVDAAGRKTTAYVGINCFDRTGPVITFSPTTVTLISGTDAAVFRDLLEQGVTVTDNSTATVDIILSHDDISAVNLSMPGQYAVAFTAKDLAGNITTANRYVKIFSADELNVSVNGLRTESGGTTVLKDKQITLTVSKLPLGDNEPYKVYLRKGLWTAGLMKGIEPQVLSGSFTLPDNDSFYTLYIVTQNRGTYLTYLYLQ